MRRLRLLATTATLALIVGATAAPALAQTATPGPVSPFGGDIDAFGGDIDAFSGDIDAFGGDIDAFSGDIDAFSTANLSLFWGADAQAGGVHPLWGNQTAFWKSIYTYSAGVDGFARTLVTAPGNAAALTGISTDLTQMTALSKSFWAPAILAATGKTFEAGFLTPFLAKWNVSLSKPASLAALSTVDRTRFLIDWHDQLMQFSGYNQVDWWMPTVHWTPSLTQTVGAGAGVVIGALDYTVSDTDLQAGMSKMSTSSTLLAGVKNPGLGHGGEVVGMLIGPHDGDGVMGIAPGATVALYNPFDATGTASWSGVTMGLLDVIALQKASVVNLSLGVPGFTFAPDWKTVYTNPFLKSLVSNTVFVHAAGNSGVAQTQNVPWDFSVDPAFIVVGSVGPNKTISSFSNTPGTACLLNNGVCSTQNLLMNHFMVAPGEWILVDAGQDGVTRASGTSFAAPQVTGAIALLQSRWSWLTKYPHETTSIILQSADDLGAPGVDPVYGYGMLDVQKSQSPLDVTKLYQATTTNGVTTKTYIKLTNPSTAGILFGTGSSYVTALEDVGGTYRDFHVPLASILTTPAVAPAAQLQAAVAAAPATKATTASRTTRYFADAEPLANPMGWDLTMTLAPRALSDQGRENQLPIASAFTLTSRSGVELNFGDGLGAQSLAGLSGVTGSSFDVRQGGDNPFLGLASGGAFAGVSASAFGAEHLAVGVTTHTAETVYADPISGEVRRLQPDVAPYTAMAAHLAWTHPVGETLQITGGYTYLREADGVLGVQSTLRTAFAAGSETDAASLGASYRISDRIRLSGSATLGRTRGQSTSAQTFAVHGDGILATAFEAALEFDGVFGRADVARLAVLQPLHVERGGLDLTSLEVIDRSSGQLGSVTRYLGVDGQARRVAFEASYATSILNGQGEASAFIHAEAALADGVRGATPSMAGGRVKVSF